jgi:uncharacterized protein YjlB
VLGVVGAYPAGQHADMCKPDAEQYARRLAMVGAVPLPDADPVRGVDGPLMSRWSAAGIEH